MNIVEALREIRRLVENGDDWGGGENVYLSRKWIIKLCDDTLAEQPPDRAQPAQQEPVAWALRPKVQRHPDRPIIRGVYWGPRTKQDFEFAELDGDEYVPLYAARKT